MVVVFNAGFDYKMTSYNLSEPIQLCLHKLTKRYLALRFKGLFCLFQENFGFVLLKYFNGFR